MHVTSLIIVVHIYWYAWILVECVVFYDPCEAYYVSFCPLASQSNTMDVLQIDSRIILYSHYTAQQCVVAPRLTVQHVPASTFVLSILCIYRYFRNSIEPQGAGEKSSCSPHPLNKSLVYSLTLACSMNPSVPYQWPSFSLSTPAARGDQSQMEHHTRTLKDRKLVIQMGIILCIYMYYRF